jgi:hypothetical protein
MNLTLSAAYRGIITLGLLGCLALSTAGCLISSDTTISHTGISVPEATFNQITPGKTSEGWVRATIGQPTSETALPDGHRLLKWTYVERRDTSAAVLFVFGGHTENETTHTANVEVATGVVTRAWRD